MKIFLTLLVFTLSTAYGATCTATSRINYSTGQILTSSALNADLNQLVTKVNGLDGGCVTDGSLEATALNSTDFAAVTNGIHQGCAVSYSDANTVSVDKCILSVNGAFVKTSTASTVTWGCSGCASEVVSTQYYVYAKTGSTGTTLNLLISTTAPNGDGYDSSSNKILGKFYNDSASAISQSSVYSWLSSGFSATTGQVSNPGLALPQNSFSFSYGDGSATGDCSSTPCTYLDQIGSSVSKVDLAGGNTYTATFTRPFAKIKCFGNANASGNPVFLKPMASANTSTITIDGIRPVDGATVVHYGTVHCEGY